MAVWFQLAMITCFEILFTDAGTSDLGSVPAIIQFFGKNNAGIHVHLDRFAAMEIAHGLTWS